METLRETWGTDSEIEQVLVRIREVFKDKEFGFGTAIGYFPWISPPQLFSYLTWLSTREYLEALWSFDDERITSDEGWTLLQKDVKFAGALKLKWTVPKFEEYTIEYTDRSGPFPCGGKKGEAAKKAAWLPGVVEVLEEWDDYVAVRVNPSRFQLNPEFELYARKNAIDNLIAAQDQAYGL